MQLKPRCAFLSSPWVNPKHWENIVDSVFLVLISSLIILCFYSILVHLQPVSYYPFLAAMVGNLILRSDNLEIPLNGLMVYRTLISVE